MYVNWGSIHLHLNWTLYFVVMVRLAAMEATTERIRFVLIKKNQQLKKLNNLNAVEIKIISKM